MVALGGLGYKFAGWETAGGVWRCLGAREAADGPNPDPAPRQLEGNG